MSRHLEGKLESPALAAAVLAPAKVGGEGREFSCCALNTVQAFSRLSKYQLFLYSLSQKSICK